MSMFAFDFAILSIHYRIVLRLVSESTLSPAAPPACERVCKDMTSLFEPNLDVLNLFRGFPAWSRVVASESVQTVRLDDVAEAAGVTFLQMDVQGGTVGAAACPSQTSRDRRFASRGLVSSALPRPAAVLRCGAVPSPPRICFPLFFAPTTRIIQPMTGDGNLWSGLNQLVWADAVFVRDFSRLELLDDRELLTMAAIMHDCYHSFDLTLHLFIKLDRGPRGRWARITSRRSGAALGGKWNSRRSRDLNQCQNPAAGISP
jgi:hypothetical protein